MRQTRYSQDSRFVYAQNERMTTIQNEPCSQNVMHSSQNEPCSQSVITVRKKQKNRGTKKQRNRGIYPTQQLRKKLDVLLLYTTNPLIPKEKANTRAVVSLFSIFKTLFIFFDALKFHSFTSLNNFNLSRIHQNLYI